MRIGIVIDILNSFCSDLEGISPARSGIEVYLYELLKALTRLNNKHQYYLLRSRAMTGSLPNEIAGELVTFPWPRLSLCARHSAAWREWAVWHHRLDVLHEVNPNQTCWRCSNYPLVITVHDVMPWLYPQWFTWKNRATFNLFAQSNFNRAKTIISVSEHSAGDLLNAMPHLAPKIRVIPIAGQTLKDSGDLRTLHSHGVNRPFILNVSTVEPRKGHQAMFEAMTILKSCGFPHQLVCVGSLGWHIGDIINHPYYLTNRENIIFAGSVDQATLKLLYENAEIFLFPSLYEGFGIPPLEAMEAGLPVVASRNSSIPEVLGDAAYYLGPRPGGQEIATALIDVLSTPGKKEHYRAMSLKQAEGFNWSRTAEQTLRVYEELE